jgi:hypothetical protein
MWVFFGSFSHVLLLLEIESTQYDLCSITKSMLKLMQKLDPKSDLLCFSYGYQKCKFVDFLNRYMGPPDCVHC